MRNFLWGVFRNTRNVCTPIHIGLEYTRRRGLAVRQAVMSDAAVVSQQDQKVPPDL